jgi:undecaprenyl-diphosphatase
MSTWILSHLSSADTRLLQAMARRRGPLLTRFFRRWTHLGDAPVLVLVVAGLLLLEGLSGGGGSGARWDSTAGWTPPSRTAALALGLAFLASQLLKRWISRPRPSLPVGLQSLVEPPDRFSFPSGHAAASLAVGLVLAMALAPGAGGWVGGCVLVGALLVGVSRCYLGVHYPGDVVAGWALGAGAVGVVMLGF